MPERSEYAPGTPSWVDIGTDVVAAKRFYGGLFGWGGRDAGPAEETGGTRESEQHSDRGGRGGERRAERHAADDPRAPASGAVQDDVVLGLGKRRAPQQRRDPAQLGPQLAAGLAALQVARQCGLLEGRELAVQLEGGPLRRALAGRRSSPADHHPFRRAPPRFVSAPLRRRLPAAGEALPH